VPLAAETVTLIPAVLLPAETEIVFVLLSSPAEADGETDEAAGAGTEELELDGVLTRPRAPQPVTASNPRETKEPNSKRTQLTSGIGRCC
jgi:hypothetical protein